MKLETRTTFGRPSIVLIPTEEEAKMLDEALGDCGRGPIELKAYLKMTDGYGPAYLSVWNESMNPEMKTPNE
jgi:hypothetical protein